MRDMVIDATRIDPKKLVEVKLCQIVVLGQLM